MGRERGRQERTPVMWMFIHGIIASALGITAGLLINWFPPQASTQAQKVDTVWNVLIVVSVPIFVTVMIIVLFSVRNFRMRPGEENLDGPPIHGNTKLEVYWTAGPAIILVALCSYSYVELRAIEKPQRGEMRVNVTGQQFAWTFEYPQAKGKPISSTRLYLPVDKPVRFFVRSPDVIHDFWVPAFRMKVDAVPGIETSYRITPRRKGTYPVVCAELCGLGHSLMRNRATVTSPTQFATWIAKQKAPAPAQASAGGKPDAKTTGQTDPDIGKAPQGEKAREHRQRISDPSKDHAAGREDLMPKDDAGTLSAVELDALVKYLQKVAAS